MNYLTKTPVLQLKQSNLPLLLYLLNEQFVRERTCWDTRATDSIIKSGQNDTEASILYKEDWQSICIQSL